MGGCISQLINIFCPSEAPGEEDVQEAQTPTRTYNRSSSMDVTRAPHMNSRGTSTRDWQGNGQSLTTKIDAVTECRQDTAVGERPQQTVDPSSQGSFPLGGENGVSGPSSLFLPTTAAFVSEQRQDTPDANIIIYGETGVGKSSLVNLIANQTLARTSNDSVGCTFHHERYSVALGNMSCSLWDTAGLDEGSEGTVPAEEAERNLKDLIQELAHSGGIHLVIYCIRGTRLTRALKRNYDLFYGTVCRRKVPVALVVTGLEYQEDMMESWWTENEPELRRNGMLFDAHACITTLDVTDDDIQKRRAESRKLLCELVVKYSAFRGWKTHSSFLSLILPQLQAAFQGTSPAGKRAVATRKAMICGSCKRFSPVTTTRRGKGTVTTIGNRKYELLHVEKHALETITPGMCAGVGILLFFPSSLVDNQISPADIGALKKFHDFAGGLNCPVIVALEGCDDEAVRASQGEVATRHRDIRAHFVAIPNSNEGPKLEEMIDILCLDQADVVGCHGVAQATRTSGL